MYFLLSPMELRAEVHIEQTSYKMYDAIHQNGRTLLDTLRVSSPIRINGKTYIGHANWNVTWKFQTTNLQNNTCRISSIETNITSTITLPNLTSTDTATNNQFRIYLSVLNSHESGHVNNGIKAAHEINNAIVYQPSATNCHDLNLSANKAAHQIIKKYQLRDKDYDLITKHGKSQGAWLPN